MSVRPIDLHRLQLAGSPTVSPDGRVVVSIQRSASNAEYAHRLWLFDEGVEPTRVVEEDGDWAELVPRFSPDGTYLAYVSDRSGSRQVWICDWEQRCAAAMDPLPGSVRQVFWIAEREVLALVDSPAQLYEAGKPAVVSWLRYKSDGRTTFFERPSELWQGVLGEPWHRLEASPGRITAVDVFRDGVAYAVAPLCSDAISETAEVRFLQLATKRDSLLWACPAPVDALVVSDTEPTIIAVTAGRSGPIPHQPGLWRIGLNHPPEELFAWADLSFEYAVQGDAHRTESPARVAVPFLDGAVLAVATCAEDVALFIGNVKTGSLCRLSPSGSSVTDFAVSLGGRLALCLESPQRPTELFVADLPMSLLASNVAGGPSRAPTAVSGAPTPERERARVASLRPITATGRESQRSSSTMSGATGWPREAPMGPDATTVPGSPASCRVGIGDGDPTTAVDVVKLRQWSRLSDRCTSETEMSVPTKVTVTASDGTVLRGLLYLPTGPGPHPLVVRVHGGPHLTSGTSFNFEVQTQVAAGYAVLLPNIRGSAGWGQVFRAAIVDQWGRLDFSDLMAMVETTVDRPEIDSRRVYLLGGSYGGFLTNWAITQTDRFIAAVSERSISNFISKYGTSDNGFLFNRNELGGADLFDESIAVLVDRSPLRHAASIRTPLLLLHGENDQRCPIEQSEQLFVALRRLGQEATMVRFAGESHEIGIRGRPDHRIARLQFILEWLDGHS